MGRLFASIVVVGISACSSDAPQRAEQVEQAAVDPWLEELDDEPPANPRVEPPGPATTQTDVQTPDLAERVPEPPPPTEAEKATEHDLPGSGTRTPAGVRKRSKPTRSTAVVPAEADREPMPTAPGTPVAKAPESAATQPASGNASESTTTQPESAAGKASAAAKPEPSSPAEPPPLTLADFQGTYVFVGGQKQRDALTQTIETAAASLPAIIRGVGRRRLTKTNPIARSVAITVSGDAVTTAFSGGFDPTATVGGGQVTWKNKTSGDTYRVRLQHRGTKLIQIIAGDDGVKTTVFVLSKDRKRLTVHHKIVADRLPDPMTYRLSYARK